MVRINLCLVMILIIFIEPMKILGYYELSGPKLFDLQNDGCVCDSCDSISNCGVLLRCKVLINCTVDFDPAKNVKACVKT